MKRSKNLPAIGLGILLAACLAGWYATRETDQGPKPSKPSETANQTSLIDQRLVQTAQKMAALAATAGEQDLAREALRLTDHELDQAFATALREAITPVVLPPGPLQQLATRISLLKVRVASSQQHIAQLTKDAATQEAAAGQQELAKAQLALDEDELEDAQQDLARQGGDEHARLQRALQEHEAAQHQMSQVLRTPNARGTSTLSDQVQAWLALNDRNRQVLAARLEAANAASTIERAHDNLEALLSHKPAAAADSASNEELQASDAVVARLRRLSDQRKTLTELDRRIQDSRQLASAYQRWGGLVEIQRLGVLHLVLRSLGAILAILLMVVLLEGAVRHAFRHQKTDHRRLHQLRMMAGIAVRVLGTLVILLIVFGFPTQITAIVGLATAGLTVVLKDFIVSFFGWFVLMGKNGIHLGDWVEIEGVGGEVIEIGVLKTVLLEMGDWTNTGHPTGRHVSFVNSFAIEGHYFNFSTAGQWLWDELQVMLPSTGDPYQMAEEIRQTVERETEADARQAELDWERVTHQYGTRTFSGKPSVDLKPSINRLDVNVRYITRAPQRYEVKSRLFQKIVGMLHQPASVAKPT